MTKTPLAFDDDANEADAAADSQASTCKISILLAFAMLMRGDCGWKCSGH